MRTQQQIRQFAENKYREYLKTHIIAGEFFPLWVPFGRLSTTASLPELIDSVRELVGGSSKHLGYGYEVVLTETPTRRHGPQNLPSEVSFRTEEDYLRYLGKLGEASQFKRNVALTRARIPALVKWMECNISRSVEHLDAWPKLVEVCEWFIAHPRPACFVREIPVAVHTKFIEEHQSVLSAMLVHLLPDDHDPLADNFHARFFLKDKEPLVRVRQLDPALYEMTKLSLPDFLVPVSVFNALPFSEVPRVLVVENETTFHSLPLIAGTVVILGMGNGVHRIGEAPWLRKGERVVYWGDVDTMGVTILGWLRRHLPHARSVLMDEATLAQFPAAEVEDRTDSTPTVEEPLLTPAEWRCYRTVASKTPRRRLEQERIPTAFAIKRIADAFNA